MHQSLLPGKNRGLRAIKHMELAKNVTHMDFHGFFADHQFFRDSGIGESIGDETQHF